MRVWLMGLLFLMFGCGTQNSVQPNESEVKSKKIMNSGSWSTFSSSFNLLVEDLNLVEKVDSKDPQFCFHVGRLMGSALSLSKNLESAMAHWTLDNDNYNAIYTAILKLKGIRDQNICSQKSTPEDSAAVLNKLRVLCTSISQTLSKAVQYR